jgi:hypothetical protein
MDGAVKQFKQLKRRLTPFRVVAKMAGISILEGARLWIAGHAIN